MAMNPSPCSGNQTTVSELSFQKIYAKVAELLTKIFNNLNKMNLAEYSNAKLETTISFKFSMWSRETELIKGNISKT